MSLAQVVYNISTDSDFAAQWRRDPEGALAGRGLNLSQEEMAFLSAGLKQDGVSGRKVRLSQIALAGSNWK